jgi:hypothetical protein
VIEKAPAHDVIEFVAGDLFHNVPPSQAVMLKVWHDKSTTLKF